MGKEFFKFISKHGKSYATKEEFEHRITIFKSNLAKIRAENAKPENTFRVTVNKFADWSPAEFKKILNAKRTGKVSYSLSSSESSQDVPVKDLPESIDWRK